MRVLVLSETYPNNSGTVTLMYVHTRNLYYKAHGIEVTELSFSADESYTFQGIPVITLSEYEAKSEEYDMLILHAANLKHHYRFLKKYGERFEKFLFFYHGHEVLRLWSVYSKNYPFIKTSKTRILIQDIYDSFKLCVWRRYLSKVINKSHLIFVSKWMYDEFLKWVKIPSSVLNGHYSITYNCVGKKFEEESFDDECSKEFDFITIRSNLDNSKYAVDIVNNLAKNTPKGRFLLVGKGNFFLHNEKAPNLVWYDKTMLHEEIIENLNKSRFALMPTRTDAQGLMMCEMAAFGIPVITSDIPVCHEVFDGFSNASFICNDNIGNLNEYLVSKSESVKDTRYFEDTTAGKEIQIIRSFGGCV